MCTARSLPYRAGGEVCVGGISVQGGSQSKGNLSRGVSVQKVLQGVSLDRHWLILLPDCLQIHGWEPSHCVGILVRVVPHGTTRAPAQEHHEIDIGGTWHKE